MRVTGCCRVTILAKPRDVGEGVLADALGAGLGKCGQPLFYAALLPGLSPLGIANLFSKPVRFALGLHVMLHPNKTEQGARDRRL